MKTICGGLLYKQTSQIKHLRVKLGRREGGREVRAWDDGGAG